MSGERPGPAQTMATALHERGVASMVSRSDNGLLIRVGNRYVPRLLELLAPTPAPPNPDTDGGLHHSCLNPIVCAVCLRAAATPAPVTPPTTIYGNGANPENTLYPTPPETVPVPRAALDRLVDCHRFFCTSGTTPCCPAGEWIAATGVSGE